MSSLNIEGESSSTSFPAYSGRGGGAAASTVGQSKTVTYVLILINVIVLWSWHRHSSTKTSSSSFTHYSSTHKKGISSSPRVGEGGGSIYSTPSKSSLNNEAAFSYNSPAASSISSKKDLDATVQEQQQDSQHLKEKEKAQNYAEAIRSNILIDTLPRADKIVIPALLPVEEYSQPLQKLRPFTTASHEWLLVSPPGDVPYPLLYYLTKTYGGNSRYNDQRIVLDIGTGFVLSALSMAAGGSSVYSMDLSQRRYAAFRGRPRTAWLRKLKETQPDIGDIMFANAHLLDAPDFRKYLKGAWLMYLDTYNEPDANPFERQFFRRILREAPDYKGILIIDDIHLNRQMENWWKEIQDGALENGYSAYDVTRIGAKTGTGLVDFSGLVVNFVDPPEKSWTL